MHPCVHAQATPDKPAFVMAASGEATTYRELDDRSNQGAQLFRALGLQAGDAVAMMLENTGLYFEALWAAQRAGLRYTAVSSRLTPGEVAYIVQDSGAKAMVIASTLADVALPLAPLIPDVKLLMTGEAAGPYQAFEAARARYPAEPIADETAGGSMLYSSGTTGRPKGVKHPLPLTPLTAPDARIERLTSVYGFGEDSVYLCPAPLYHAAPLGWSMSVQRLGGVVILMEKFDAEQALALIERHRVTHVQFVPTHFVRMLKLPEAVRRRYDHSSLRSVVHAAAPCPVPVKEKMIDWWGPIVSEYYAGTEGNGMTIVHAAEWLAHKGTVGRAVPGVEVKICDEDGEPLPPRREGAIYFAGGAPFESTTPRRSSPTPPIGTAGPASATSAGWTRRATSTSPTARAS